MRDDPNEDVRAGASDAGESAPTNPEQERQPAAPQAVSQGRDAHDTTRHGTPHGSDVLNDEDVSQIESHGRTVIDHSRQAEAHGVDVIDLGPKTSSSEEQPER